jgi:hypothetical protein
MMIVKATSIRMTNSPEVWEIGLTPCSHKLIEIYRKLGLASLAEAKVG